MKNMKNMKKAMTWLLIGALCLQFGSEGLGVATVTAKETEMLTMDEGSQEADDDMGDDVSVETGDELSDDEPGFEQSQIQITEDNWKYILDEEGNLAIVGYGIQDTVEVWEEQEKADPITLEIPATLTISVSGNDVEKEVTAIGVWGNGEAYYAWPRNMKNVTIPSTVRTIEGHAFNNTSLSTIEIPENITSIGEAAFFDCNDLTSVTFSGNSRLTDIGESAFFWCDKLTAIRLPASLTNLGPSSFSRCEALETVILPENLERIELLAFAHCNSLTTIELPNTLTFIGGSAFSDCGLTEITIPDSVTEIQLDAFAGCKDLENIQLPNNLTEIPSGLFKHCASLKYIEIPGTVEWIGDNAFNGCTSLESITIPSGLLSLSREMFVDCSSLKRVVLPNSLFCIGRDAFKNCSSLEEIVLPNSIRTIEERAFWGCTSFTEFYIPRSVEKMGFEIFYDCTSLEKVHIPKSVTKIDVDCFIGCPETLTIYTQPEAYAVEYANKYNIPVEYEELEEPTEYPTEEPKDLQNPKKTDSAVTYDCVYFGSYPQSDVTGQTKEKVKWRVLSVNEDMALLISDKNLDVQKYNEVDEQVTWEDCTLRSWLNGYGADSNRCERDFSNNNFISKLFTDEEQEAIPQMTVTADDSFGFNQGNDTEDQIFLLSCKEATNPDYGFSEDAEEYDTARISYNTAYAAAGGSSRFEETTDTENSARWWLRSMKDELTESYIEADGSVDYTQPMDVETTAVRPVLYLDLTSSLWEYAGTDTVNNRCSHQNIKTEGAKQATCTEAGYTGDDCCKDCGSTIMFGETIPAKGHQWDNGSVTKAATATEDGIKTITCTVCHITKTEAIKATGVVVGTKWTDEKTNSIYKVTSVTDKTVEYTKPAASNVTKATIPASVTLGGTTYKVTSVAAKAFKDCKKLKTVTIGKNVTAIGDQAFYKCTVLNKITIPAQVNNIGKSAFYGCKNLKNITIKTTKLTSKNVGSKAFKGIHAKATIKVPKKKLSAYKKLLKQKGVGSKATIKK